MRVRIAVSFELPENCSREEAVKYVVDAVRTMKGGYGPQYPMFYMEADTVRATTVTTRNNKRTILRAE